MFSCYLYSQKHQACKEWAFLEGLGVRKFQLASNQCDQCFPWITGKRTSFHKLGLLADQLLFPYAVEWTPGVLRQTWRALPATALPVGRRGGNTNTFFAGFFVCFFCRLCFFCHAFFADQRPLPPPPEALGPSPPCPKQARPRQRVPPGRLAAPGCCRASHPFAGGRPPRRPAAVADASFCFFGGFDLEKFCVPFLPFR